MGTFFRSAYGIDNEQGFMQGAGRLLLAPYDPTGATWPAGIEDVLLPATGATQWDAVAPFVDAGYTKTGINITRNNSEEEYTIDQSQAAFRRRPTNWEMSVGTQLAESTLETFKIAWELTDAIATITKTPPQLNERHIGMGAPTKYVERMVAVAFQFDDNTVRLFVWRKSTHAAQESGFTLQQTGEQVSLPTRFNCQVDPEQAESTQFGEIFEQVPAP